jgi:hypothetical protein
MAACAKLSGCPFFHDKMANMPSAADALKNSFCLGDHSGCARWLVSSAGKPVPSDLFPNHKHRVAALLQAKP